MLVASIATAMLMAGVLAMLLYLISIEQGEGAQTLLAIRRTEAQLAQLRAEKSRLEAELTRPENEEVLERSLFLNALLLRKGISWTLIFSDLEKVLPYNVKLVQVRPQINPDNQIQLEMVVAAKATEPVIEMLKAMENSDVFAATSVSVALPPSETEPLYRYRLGVRYNREL